MSEPNRVRTWEAALRRKNFHATKWSSICSFHFKAECFNRTGQTVRLHNGITCDCFVLITKNSDAGISSIVANMLFSVLQLSNIHYFTIKGIFAEKN